MDYNIQISNNFAVYRPSHAHIGKKNRNKQKNNKRDPIPLKVTEEITKVEWTDDFTESNKYDETHQSENTYEHQVI